ncbi:HD/PDEase domain protein [Acididesulfobacillus acetoxydans]|uniref:HD/PDEase domain protein n=1 Tax=Acididesulfobacillus acetoxydans TaxID=1561005 RepID=A0A8S0VYY6_9FIRM|nr:HDIG domain-containing metalloprotein [Acididesulfobacillus acetoxydans]CAA7603473.1 HD/PDEase domain protein [Acididesulfobacillus acetoxydans]CEJ06824.1 Metal dependent phosphohydrolase [Acididesulfobacillus acetoxydans]
MDKFVPNTLWRRVIALAVYFLVFTFLLSSGLFVTKVNIKVGEPSPATISAPWAMDVKDMERFRQDQAAAEKATPPVYKPDDSYLSGLANDLDQSFSALRSAVASGTDSAAKAAHLRQTSPFTALPEGVLVTLVSTKADSSNATEQTANQIILGDARDLQYGARTEADVAPLRDRMKQDINRSALSDEMKVFLQAFVDYRVTQPTLVKDKEATAQLAKENADKINIQNYTVHYQANQKIIGVGEIVDSKAFQVLEAYGFVNSNSALRLVGGIAVIVLLGMGALLAFAYQYKPQIFASTRKLVLVGLTMALVLSIAKGINALNLGAQYTSLTGFLIPVAWATTAVAILADAELGVVVALVLAVFVAVLVDPRLETAVGLQVGLVALFGGVTGVHSVSRLSQRSDLARAGLFVSAVNVLVVSGIDLMSGAQLTVWAVGLILAVVNGIASSVLTVGTLHWFESGFQITSAVRLLELSNPNRPLLKRLLVEAPGTYHHSILVGNLAEAAAEEIHADATLVRVGSMYHDIGKLKRPYFFIENQFAQDNPHDKIAPTLSSLIITSHVKDGLELAREDKLPEPVTNIISQHHGDSLVTFFYHKALEENEEVPEEAFRYDAPRPQSKEAALVSLADSVEAAVRSLRQPTPGRIEGLVRKIIKEKFNDDQLDQCDLTFRDLDRIAMAFVRVLSGIFHSRVEYPELPAGKSGSSEGAKRANQATKHAEKPPAEKAADKRTEQTPEGKAGEKPDGTAADKQSGGPAEKISRAEEKPAGAGEHCE